LHIEPIGVVVLRQYEWYLLCRSREKSAIGGHLGLPKGGFLDD
jgi:hypothetical protein